MFIMPNCWRNFMCFCSSDSAFVKPSAGISAVLTHTTSSLSSSTSSRIQLWLTSTCLSLVLSFSSALFAIRTVCWLSQYSVGLVSGSKPMLLNVLIHQAISDPATDSAESSASVVDFVTACCMVAFQSITIPYSLKRYPNELLRVWGSSANAASEAPKNNGS
ncbi:hypothetical protein BS50DRAFT_288554 [Corynespora cassiicola Philippines]|uniref:Uncharacterized protein n=1 Tax=Corynespora cassiicola Philippines TaxID=1448308 RepID=A0A2T2N0Q0_CORCC|nr:hypothetical protein BS50DRAFT_288554 [Corynespora cassiicola Philippines]